MKKLALITFNGMQDPFNKMGEDGPILSILKQRPVDRILLLYIPEVKERAEETRREIGERYKSRDVQMVPLEIHDPTNYSEILSALRAGLPKHLEDHKYSYIVSVSSGTPQIHACWLLLSASGEITANIVYLREKKYIRSNEEAIREINPRANYFPEILPKAVVPEVPRSDEKVISDAIEKIGIIGSSKEFKKLLCEAVIVGENALNCLILGETGTGKEFLARFIHMVGRRMNGPFITLNCAAIPETLIDSELFGYEKGAFTGAVQRRIGKFHLADGGILFLDEIGDMPLSVQVKILRVIENGSFFRVGGEREEKVDIQFIAATNRNMDKAIESGQFRQDLYHRLAGKIIEIPPLRRRRDDIPLLARRFIKRWAEEMKKEVTFSQDALNRLKEYSWPGNIRELDMVIRRTIAFSNKDTVGAEDLLFEKPLYGIRGEPPLPDLYEGFSIKKYLSEIRHKLFEKALTQANGKKKMAARLLGITSQAISKYLKNKPEFKK